MRWEGGEAERRRREKTEHSQRKEKWGEELRGRGWRGGGWVGGVLVVMVPNPPSSGRYFCGGGKRCSVSFSHSGTHCGGGCDEEKSCVVTNGVSPLVVVVVAARGWG